MTPFKNHNNNKILTFQAMALLTTPTQKPIYISPLLPKNNPTNTPTFVHFISKSNRIHRTTSISNMVFNTAATKIGSYEPESKGAAAQALKKDLEPNSTPEGDSSEDGCLKPCIGARDDEPVRCEILPEERKILLSDVVVKKSRDVFGGRKWNALDLETAGVVLGLHLLTLFAPFNFNWNAFGVALVLYVVTALLGITLSFHRNLTHRSFKLPKWLEYTFAYCGVQALQGSPIDWVSTHRYHHQFCDSEGDPHSPIEGFWFSHVSWLFDHNLVIERCGGPNNVVDLEKQSFYRFLKSTYIMHPIALGALLFAMGGFPFIVWGMGVRIAWVYHITWLVNSACHVWGKQAWKTGDLSRNNWWVALLTFGEGWHNNHHAFEFSARHGLEWWQLDMTWYVVRFLQVIGLATDVKLPTQVQKQRMSLTPDARLA